MCGHGSDDIKFVFIHSWTVVNMIGIRQAGMSMLQELSRFGTACPSKMHEDAEAGWDLSSMTRYSLRGGVQRSTKT
jgi:hypothetical protein